MTETQQPMNDDVQTLKDDIAFIRALTEDGGSAMTRDAALLAAAGTIFGVTTFLYWLVFAGFLALPGGDWLWIAASALFVVVMLIIRRGDARRGIATRAMQAAWAGVGGGIIVAGVALAVAAARLDLPVLAVGVFPIVLFTLYGAAWGVAAAVMRRGWVVLIAGGCFAAAVACGWVLGTPAEWLVLSGGLFVLVALPGTFIAWQLRGA